MDLSKISNSDLVVRLEKLARTERKITHLVLWHINEAEARKLYADLGFTSMYEYLNKHLGYAESSAYRRLQSARLLKQLPSISEKLEDGSLNLTQLTQVQKCIKTEEKFGNSVSLEQKSQILDQIVGKSNLETQKVLAVEFNQPVQSHEVLSPQSDNSYRLELILTENQMKRLQQVRDLHSHSLPDSSWVNVIDYLLSKELKKFECKKPSHETTHAKETFEDPSFLSEPTKRKALPVEVKRAIYKHAQGRCEFVSSITGRRCEGTHQVQDDHRIPLAFGGSNAPQNLRLLCRTHNLSEARRWGLRPHSRGKLNNELRNEEA